MKTTLISLVTLLIFATLSANDADAQDAVTSNPDKYKVIFENDRVRLLEYHDQPGDVSIQHEHPPHLVYFLSNFEREFIDAEGSKTRAELKTGDAIWIPANKHSGRNIGTTPTHALLFELKDSAKTDGAQSANE